MGTVTMTEFNQQVSAVTRRVTELGETIRVTNRGRVVLRLIPEPQTTGSVLDALVTTGLAAAPSQQHRSIGQRQPVRLSRDLGEILDEVNADVEF